MPFAAEIQSARQSLGLSQSGALPYLQAAQACTSLKTLQSWEQGAKTPSALVQAAALAALRPPNPARRRKGQNAELSDSRPL